MLYDHALTFDDEVQLVWHARPSFAKYAFLYNRYSAAGVLIAVQYCACPFVFEVLKLILVYPPFLLDEKSPERRQSQCQWLGLESGMFLPRDFLRFRCNISHWQACQRFYAVLTLFATFSLAIANILVLLRVVSIWDRNKASFMP